MRKFSARGMVRCPTRVSRAGTRMLIYGREISRQDLLASRSPALLASARLRLHALLNLSRVYKYLSTRRKPLSLDFPTTPTDSSSISILVQSRARRQFLSTLLLFFLQPGLDACSLFGDDVLADEISRVVKAYFPPRFYRD